MRFSFLLLTSLFYWTYVSAVTIQKRDHWHDDGDIIDDFDEAWEAFYDIDGFDSDDIKDPEVKNQRMQSFKEFADIVYEINHDDDIPYECENNFFSILTKEERESYLGLNVSLATLNSVKRDSSLPYEWYSDSSEVGVTSRELAMKALPPIKDQKQCGSCWAFGGAASLEAEIFMVSGKRIPLSEQEFTDCAMTTDGCEGGWMSYCFNYAYTNRRVAPESAARYSAKYQAAQGRDAFCRSYAGKANALKGSDFNIAVERDVYVANSAEKQMETKDFIKLVQNAASKHVLAVAIHASSKLMSYKSGVVRDLEASSKSVNHAVNIVGFGRSSKKGLNYWLIRNSWGEKWGKNGYFYLDREPKNHIGIETIVHFPKLTCKGSGCQPKTSDDAGSVPSDPGDDKKECNAASGNYPCPSKGNQCYHCHQCPETKDKCRDKKDGDESKNNDDSDEDKDESKGDDSDENNDESEDENSDNDGHNDNDSDEYEDENKDNNTDEPSTAANDQ